MPSSAAQAPHRVMRGPLAPGVPTQQWRMWKCLSNPSPCRAHSIMLISYKAQRAPSAPVCSGPRRALASLRARKRVWNAYAICADAIQSVHHGNAFLDAPGRVRGQRRRLSARAGGVSRSRRIGTTGSHAAALAEGATVVCRVSARWTMPCPCLPVGGRPPRGAWASGGLRVRGRRSLRWLMGLGLSLILGFYGVCFLGLACAGFPTAPHDGATPAQR